MIKNGIRQGYVPNKSVSIKPVIPVLPKSTIKPDLNPTNAILNRYIAYAGKTIQANSN
jgi:hypothetical protein